MIKYPDDPTAIAGPSLFRTSRPPSVRQGNVSISADLQHLSLIIYEIPSQRAQALAPRSFQIEESIKAGRAGRKTSWLSVVSFLDQGSKHDGHRGFEQTSYRLHVLSDGKPAHFLLGISLGSLSAVAMRNLWPAPWHLSAMEFQIAYDKGEGRYRDYRLQTQSQWANATWEISDSGESLLADRLGDLSLPSSMAANTFNNYFQRRDGALGLYRSRYQNTAFTLGKLKHAQSDMLERLGLLIDDELLHPTLVAIQHQTSCQIFSPTIVGETRVRTNSFELEQSQLAFAS